MVASKFFVQVSEKTFGQFRFASFVFRAWYEPMDTFLGCYLNLNYSLPYRLLSSSPSKYSYILAKKSACTRTAPHDGQCGYSLTVQFQSQDISASPLLPGIISIAMLFGSKWSRGGVLNMPNDIDRRLLCATRSPTEIEGKR